MSRLNPRTVTAVWTAFSRGDIPGERKGPGRSVYEVCTALGEGHDTEDVLAALRHLEANGELSSVFMSRGAHDDTPPLQLTLWWRDAPGRRPAAEASA